MYAFKLKIVVSWKIVRVKLLNIRQLSKIEEGAEVLGDVFLIFYCNFGCFFSLHIEQGKGGGCATGA